MGHATSILTFTASMALRKKLPKKFSATFLDFAKPAFDRMGIEPNSREGEALLKTSWMVWNAVVFADIGGQPHYLEQLRDPANLTPASRVIVDWLIERKRTRFKTTNWLVGDCSLRQVRGEWRLRIEARAEPTPAEPRQR
mgnify:CR=1 FL=1